MFGYAIRAGGHIVSSVDGLTEVADRAAEAGEIARSLYWQAPEAIETTAAEVDKGLQQDRATMALPRLSAVPPSTLWRNRLDAMVGPGRDDRVGQPWPADPAAAAARAEADADAAVAVARLSLREAHRAVLDARLAVLRAGDSATVAAAVRGYRPLRPGHAATRYGHAVGGGAKSELAYVVIAKPRPILVKLAVGLGIGLAYLAFLTAFGWEAKSEILPYLAPYALSGVIGGVVCTNALSWDANRVRASLTGGERLWLVLLSKNVTMFLLVGAVGLVLSVLLSIVAGEPAALLKAVGELVTMMLIWLGVGNVVSVANPLRVEPLRERRRDGTFRPFLLTFVTSYVLGLGVNLMLTWRVWAKNSMIQELGGAWVPVLMLVLSAAVSYLLLTVLAVSMSTQPRIRRRILREMVDYRALKAERPQAPAADPGGRPSSEEAG